MLPICGDEGNVSLRVCVRGGWGGGVSGWWGEGEKWQSVSKKKIFLIARHGEIFVMKICKT